MANINLPIKSIALAEGVLTGFTDEGSMSPRQVAEAILSDC